MTMHPLDIIRRDMAVAKTLTDRPRRTMRQESPKTLAWMEKHLGIPFKDARATAEFDDIKECTSSSAFWWCERWGSH